MAGNHDVAVVLSAAAFAVVMWAVCEARAVAARRRARTMQS